MRKKNCLCGWSLTKCVAQSTPVVTTSLLPQLKVWCTNGVVYGYAKFADRSMRSRCGNHGQSICVAGRCAVLPRFNEHWRRWHSSDLRQRATAIELLRSCCLVYVDATFEVVPLLFYQLFTVFVQHTDHSFLVTRPWPGKQLHCIKASSIDQSINQYIYNAPWYRGACYTVRIMPKQREMS